MKHIKRLFSTLLVLALALTFAIPAFAADGDVTITMKEKNDEALGSYSAYQLMTVTVAPGAAEGDGSTGYSYTVNSKYSAILQEVTGKTTDEDVIKYLESIKDNAAEVRKFADDVYAKLAGTDGDYTADAGVFTVPMGYYLIVETDDNGITSLVMLDTADKTNIDVTTKEELPTREKKVDEKNDTTGEEKKLQDGADYDIGDDVPFTLSGNIAADYMSYTKGYKLVLHDKMEDGLTFDPNSVVVKIRGVELTKGTDYTLNYPISEGDGCTFEIVIEDLQKVDAVKNAAAMK